MKEKRTNSADIEMGLCARELGKAGRRSHAEQRNLLSGAHHARGHERGLQRGATGQKSFSERSREHINL